MKILKILLAKKLSNKEIELTISNENAKRLDAKYKEFTNSYTYTSTDIKIDTSELYYGFQFNGAKY